MYLSTDATSDKLAYVLKRAVDTDRPLVFLCIGSDKCTGDSLGPIIGYKLSKHKCLHVYGTLSDPVHAVNLNSTINYIKSSYNNPFIIAIDASLGRINTVGLVTIRKGPLQPGTGVGKHLPSVGDLHITGIVNTNIASNLVILQTTSLGSIVKMADYIYSGIVTMLFRSVEVDKTTI